MKTCSINTGASVCLCLAAAVLTSRQHVSIVPSHCCLFNNGGLWEKMLSRAAGKFLATTLRVAAGQSLKQGCHTPCKHSSVPFILVSCSSKFERGQWGWAAHSAASPTSVQEPRLVMGYFQYLSVGSITASLLQENQSICYEMSMITDWCQFLHPLVTKVNSGSIFPRHPNFDTLFRKSNRGENQLYSRPVSQDL